MRRCLAALFRTHARLHVLWVAALMASLLGACSTGNYPIDIFPEMHYQQSYKAQEPARLDSPAEAVPVFSSAPNKTGAELYLINCAQCHGVAGKGDGGVLRTMSEKYGYTPALDPDLTSTAVQAIPDDGLLSIISNGVVVMPSFSKLLTQDERKLVVQHFRQLR